MGLSTTSIRTRLMKDFLASPLIDNSLRGYWCEAMVAEALGPTCQIVSGGWHPWDLQIGPSKAAFPDRLRIQVKNSARLQVWTPQGGKGSDCLFNLTYRKRPYSVEGEANTPCEAEGFMCDLFILCHHPVKDHALADQTDPAQWQFYLLPVVGQRSAVTDIELSWVREKLRRDGRSSSLQRRPESLPKGIRGRREVSAIGIEDLTVPSLWDALGIQTEID